MKLTKVQITNYKSVWDSTEFSIDDVTCLVGKNESGKTAVLQALHRLNPVEESTNDLGFRVDIDYPRSKLTEYEDAVQLHNEPPSMVVTATFSLDTKEIDETKRVFGSDCFVEDEPHLILSKGYSNKLNYEVSVNEEKITNFLIGSAQLSDTLKRIIDEKEILDDIIGVLRLDEENPDASTSLIKQLEYINDRGANVWVFEELLKNRIPKFLYFDEYYQMKGQDNLDALHSRLSNDDLTPSDHPLIGLIQLAGLDLPQLLNPKRATSLLARLEATANNLTNRVLSHWSQNKHLKMKFDVRQAYPEDPPGMTVGTNIWGFVEDTVHNASTELGSRSRGFVWFFSFLAWYSKLRQEEHNLILLLDEPGLSLHAKAQEDLLRYIENELKPHHQLIYTTHSPFMIDPYNITRARIVQDMSIERDPNSLTDEDLGTKVLSEIHAATSDTLFPLQSALGYEIYQNLFIGPNCLIVEGVSDLLYIEAISGLLEEKNRKGLNEEWTVTPVGGITNVPTFVALIGAQGNLNAALLIDNHKRDEQRIENLYKEKLMERNRILTYANFVSSREADVEDMFDPDFYLKLVNGVYGSSIKESALKPGSLILKRIDTYLENNQLPNTAPFNHYRPARYLNTHLDSLKDDLANHVLDRWERAFTTLNFLLRK